MTMVMGNQYGLKAAGIAFTAGISLALALSPAPTWAASAGAAAAAAPTSDFNGDFRSDLAVGVPEATDAALAGAGAISVVPGGPTGPDGTKKLTITQDTTGVPGSSEAGDNFGGATAYDDINADGYADLAVASPGEDDTSGNTDAGGITLFYGSATGLTPSSSVFMAPLTSRTPGDACGAATTVGDFNADGSADVLAFCPGSWSLWWIDGATRTVRSAASAPTLAASTQSVTSLANSHAAAGDVNHDGYTDALITYTQPDGTQPLIVLPGSANGITTDTAITLDGAGGVSLATGDINGDRITDVAVGRPDAATGGAVTAYYGSATGLSTTNATTINQDSTDVPGAAESGDDLGASVAVGDNNADGYADVYAGIPGEDLTVNSVNQADAGSSVLLRGSAAGLTGTGSFGVNQETTDVSGTGEAGDRLGTAVSLTDFDNNEYPYADLGIGADGENTGDGTVMVILGNATSIAPTSTTYYGPGTLGISAASHIGDVLAP